MKTLNQLKPNTISKIVSISPCCEGLGFRFNSMGVVVGKEIEVLRTGWLCPVHIRVGMTELFIRKRDAECIVVMEKN
jgi:Fe2+ transport system protein FeoA